METATAAKTGNKGEDEVWDHQKGWMTTWGALAKPSRRTGHKQGFSGSFPSREGFNFVSR